MNIKNYTSEVPVENSMMKIEKLLVNIKADRISKAYKDGVCISIKFVITINQIPVMFDLPANVEACFKALWADISRPQAGTRQRIEKQAERTAWKIVCDWVEIQCTMILLKQLEPLQAFLPYTYNESTGKTFYSTLKETNYKALLH